MKLLITYDKIIYTRRYYERTRNKKEKKKYQEQLSKKNHLESLKKEKELLESNPSVIRYLELLHLISDDTQEYTECEMGLSAFSDIALNTKKITKYMYV